MGIKENFYAIAAMAMMSGNLGRVYNDHTPRTYTHEEAEKKYRPFRKKREDETDEEYEAAWREEYKHRLQTDVAKKGLTVYEINGEIILAKNEREAQKRYKHRHK